VDNDITDFLSVSEPVATASTPTALSNEPGDGDDACSTLLDGEIATIPVTRIFASVLFGLPVNISGLEQGYSGARIREKVSDRSNSVKFLDSPRKR
jgi:hypothetical protein